MRVLSLVLVLGALSQGAAKRFEPLRVLSRARDIGAPERNDRVAVSVSLEPAKPAELQAFVDRVSDPASPSYRRYLAPEEVGSRFGMAEGRIAAVAEHLARNGLSVTRVAKNRLTILAEGNVSAAEAAFGTSIRSFRLDERDAREPERFVANASPLAMPPEIGALVVHVGGLETYTRPRRSATTLSPEQARTLYDTQGIFALGSTGSTRTVGITSFDGFRSADWGNFIAHFALPFPAAGPGSNITVVPCNGGGLSTGPAGGEGDLDIQMALGQAPLAAIRVYDSPPTFDLIAVLSEAVNENACDVISTSYSWNLQPSAAMAAHNLHLSMSAQGITYVAASGDRGTTLDPFGYPNYEPEVLSIGGTKALVDDTDGRRVIEEAWSASGGGWSTAALAFNVRPAWQVGEGVPPVTPATDFRLTPDLAFHSAGNQTGAYYFFNHGQLQGSFSGTSFAAPVFAGALALIEEFTVELGGLAPDAAGHRRLGRLQDFVYGQNGRSDLFFDLVFGSNGTLPDGTPSTCRPGWDSVTGWGPLDGAKVAPFLACATGASCGTGTPFCFGDGSLFLGPCPCANSGTPGRGCANSTSSAGARLEAAGTTNPDTIALTSAGEPPAAFSLLFQSSGLLFRPASFGDGVLCIGRRVLVLYRKKAAGGALTVPGAGDLPITARSLALGDPIAPGSSRHYQVWYRDPDPSFCPTSMKSTTNLSNAVTIPW